LKNGSLELSDYEKEKSYVSLFSLERWAYRNSRGRVGIIRENLPKVLSGVISVTGQCPQGFAGSSQSYQSVDAATQEISLIDGTRIDSGYAELQRQLESVTIELTNKKDEIKRLERSIAQPTNAGARKHRRYRLEATEAPSMKESSTIAELKEKVASLEDEIEAYKEAEDIQASGGRPFCELDPRTTGTIEDWYERGFEIKLPGRLRKTAVIDGQTIYGASDILHFAIKTGDPKLQQAITDFLKDIPGQ
jgi:hypothetical protein